MKNLFSIYIILFSLIAIPQLSFSQAPAIEISSITETVKDSVCYVHNVKQGETVYSICRAYNISYKRLLFFNPTIAEGLKFDQTLYVPKNSTQNTESKTNVQQTVVQTSPEPRQTVVADTLRSTIKQTIQDKVFYIHTVKAGQTIYSISKIYKVKTSDLYANNPDLSENLPLGLELKVPCIECQSTPTVVQTPVAMPIVPIPPATSNETKVEETIVEAPQIKKIEFTTHIVDSTETVYAISKKLHIPPEVIYDYNPVLLDESGLTPGTKLSIPENAIYKKQEFIYYEIAKNDEISKISQEYRITNEELTQANPKTSVLLEQGSYLQIPINSENKKSAIAQLRSEYTFHTVKAQETIYSLTKKYGISEKDFYKLNKNISQNGLSIGTVLKFPKAPNEINYIWCDTITRKLTAIQKTQGLYGGCCDSVIEAKNSYTIVLILPLYLTENNSFAASPEIINKPKEIYQGSYPFLEYYEGILVGLDSLKRKGVSIKLQVFDSGKDSSKVYLALNAINPETTDLIIGPVFPEFYDIVANWGKMHKIPVVSPLVAHETSMNENPYAIQVNAPQRLRQEIVVNEIIKDHNSNIILVYNSVVLEQVDVDEIKAILTKKYADSLQMNNISVTEILFPEHGITGIEKAMNPNEQNIIVVMSKNQAFINNVVTKLYRYAKRYPITLYGLPSWERFENIELDFLFNLNLHFADKGYIDYDTIEVKHFLETYRDMFKTEPTKYSFQGYDQIIYFIEAFQKYDQNFIECLPAYNKHGLHSCFMFIREEKEDGLINKKVEIIEYKKDTYERKPVISED